VVAAVLLQTTETTRVVSRTPATASGD
jgi:hypothetical protein